MIDDAINYILDLLETNSSSLINIAAIIFGAWVVKRFGRYAVSRLVRKSVRNTHDRSSKKAEQQREETITQIISNVLNVLIVPITGLLIIDQIGLDLAALIAGLGILGVAFGFGAQNLVKDIIAGLFIILENQYRVGDIVDLDGTSGLVEHITLRATVLRDLDGIVHHVPNGTIDRASNYSKDYSGINLDIGIGYNSDLTLVEKLVNQVGEELAKDPDWRDIILEAPSFMRLDEFADSAMIIKITGSVKPMQQWAIAGELRKRVKVVFDENGISIPYPQRVIHQSD